ncbi:radical SAM domain-containing protein, partial [mine drainage metagenome]
MDEGMFYDADYWHDYIAGENNISRKDAAEIMQDLPFHERLRLADSLASLQAGNTVGYAVSYNINYSNYCAASCPICAFYVPAKLRDRTGGGYELSEADVRREARKAREFHATEIHVVGGFNPYLPMEYY